MVGMKILDQQVSMLDDDTLREIFGDLSWPFLVSLVQALPRNDGKFYYEGHITRFGVNAVPIIRMWQDEHPERATLGALYNALRRAHLNRTANTLWAKLMEMNESPANALE